eukprot:jgi/Bigna1/138269/aug1.44_g12977
MPMRLVPTLKAPTLAPAMTSTELKRDATATIVFIGNGASVNVGADRLLPGEDYSAEVVVTLGPDIRQSASSAALYRTTSSALLPRIAGGTARTVGAGVSLALDASISVDPDGVASSETSIWRWSCVRARRLDNQQEEPCVLSSNFQLDQANLQLNTAYLTAGRDYTFTCNWTVASMGYVRSASIDANITVLQSTVPTVTLNRGGTTRSAIAKARASDTLQITSTVADSSGPFSYTWEETRQHLTLENEILLSSASGSNLVLKPNILLPGQTYDFVLRVTPLDGTSDSGSARLTVAVNAPPMGGALTVSPSTGVSLETEFLLNTTGWIDADIPLTYRFAFVDPISSTSEFLTGTQVSSAKTLNSLPLGNLTLEAFATDFYGAMSKAATANVSVRSPVSADSDGTCFALTVTQERLPSLVNLGQTDDVFGYIRVLSDVITEDTSATTTSDQCSSSSSTSSSNTGSSTNTSAKQTVIDSLASSLLSNINVDDNDPPTAATAEISAQLLRRLSIQKTSASSNAQQQSNQGSFVNTTVSIVDRILKAMPSLRSGDTTVSDVASALDSLLSTGDCSQHNKMLNRAISLAGISAAAMVAGEEAQAINLTHLDTSAVKTQASANFLLQGPENISVSGTLDGGADVSIVLRECLLPRPGADRDRPSTAVSVYHPNRYYISAAAYSCLTDWKAGADAVVCRCTHLTEFSVLQRENEDVRVEEHTKGIYLAVMALYIIAAGIVCYQLCRMLYWAENLKDQMNTKIIFSLMLSIAIFRIFLCLRYSRQFNEFTDMPRWILAILAATPYSLICWAYSFLVYQWGAVFHLSIKMLRAIKFADYGKYYIYGSLATTVAEIGLFVAVLGTEGSLPEAVTKACLLTGCIVIAIVSLAIGIGFMVYSTLDVVMDREEATVSDFDLQLAQNLEATLWLASVFKSNSAVADEDLLAASYFFNIVQIFSLCYLFESTILVLRARTLQSRPQTTTVKSNKTSNHHSKWGAASQKRDSIGSRVSRTGGTVSGETGQHLAIIPKFIQRSSIDDGKNDNIAIGEASPNYAELEAQSPAPQRETRDNDDDKEKWIVGEASDGTPFYTNKATGRSYWNRPSGEGATLRVRMKGNEHEDHQIEKVKLERGG